MYGVGEMQRPKPSLHAVQIADINYEQALDYDTYCFVAKSHNYNGNVAKENRKLGEETADTNAIQIVQRIRTGIRYQFSMNVQFGVQIQRNP